MAPCDRCAHCRRKLEQGFRDGGFVECKPPIEPSLWLHAFYNFAATGSITEPFVVSDENARPRDAWPFQFRPQNLIRCEGFAAVVAET